jgi:hypothetical protein
MHTTFLLENVKGQDLFGDSRTWDDSIGTYTWQFGMGVWARLSWFRIGYFVDTAPCERSGSVKSRNFLNGRITVRRSRKTLHHVNYWIYFWKGTRLTLLFENYFLYSPLGWMQETSRWSTCLYKSADFEVVKWLTQTSAVGRMQVGAWGIMLWER